ncbi:MAG TPA: hypothetical protein PL105_06885 [Caldilineaceae bacterium]|nr:hypothetical protein [Caldilineaceae bacterium]
MSTLPRVRWLALLLAVGFGVMAAGLNFDLAAVLGSLGMKATGIGAGLLAIAKIIDEAMRSIDAEKPTVWIQDGHIQRGVEQPGFWRRVL